MIEELPDAEAIKVKPFILMNPNRFVMFMITVGDITHLSPGTNLKQDERVAWTRSAVYTHTCAWQSKSNGHGGKTQRAPGRMNHRTTTHLDQIYNVIGCSVAWDIGLQTMMGKADSENVQPLNIDTTH